jgi:hypothetical protein
MNAKVFQQRARDCRKLAAACPDFYARAALIELADEFMRMAERLEQAARNSRRVRSQRGSQAGTAWHPPHSR